jgi:hypothetical protein
MAVIDIPVVDAPDNKFTIILEGQSYDIRLQWNGRDESWYLFFGLANSTPTFISKVTTSWNILRPYWGYEEVPNGILVAIDLLKTNGRLQRDSFSTKRFKLFYITSDSVEALERLNILAIDRDGIIRVDSRFFAVPTPNFGIPFDGVFTSS